MAKSYTRISADSHLEVPPDQWSHRIDKRYRDMAPKRVELPNGGDGFLVEGGLYRGGMNLYAGATPEDLDPNRLKWDEQPGTGGGEQRLEEMDRDGVDAEVEFPGVGGVRNMSRGIPDDEAYVALTRAYNEWLVNDFCSADPERLIGVGCIPERGLDAAMEALEYCG